MRALAAAIVFIAVLATLSYGTPESEGEVVASDVTPVLDVYMEYGMGNILDTFSGTYTKDLVCDPDTTAAFALSPSDLDTILALANEVGFFDCPDTLRSPPGWGMSPNAGPDVLRLKIGDRDHTVTSFYPSDPESEYPRRILQLRSLIRDIVESKEEYEALPCPRGAYQ